MNYIFRFELPTGNLYLTFLLQNFDIRHFYLDS